MVIEKKHSPRRSRKSSIRQSSRRDAQLSTEEGSRPPVVKLFRERQRMRKRIARDRKQRYRTFIKQISKATGPLPEDFGLRAAVLQPGKRPLRILAEGDSWFEYPLPWPEGDGVIYQLQKLLGYSIANMAHHGLEVDQMMGLSKRQEIIFRLINTPVKYDALLFSGGGDDLVGDRFCIWLRDTPPPVPPVQMLDDNAVDAGLAILEAEYHELVDIRDQYSSQTVIFVNGYDFPPITGEGVCGDGPWLKPSLDYAYKHLGVTTPNSNDEYLVVRELLQRFGKMLNRVATDPKVKGFVVVPTQGTLTPTNSDWQNEIHPSSAGFTKIAQKFQAALASKFP